MKLFDDDNSARKSIIKKVKTNEKGKKKEIKLSGSQIIANGNNYKAPFLLPPGLI